MIAGRDALSRYLTRTAALALLLALTPAAAAAQQGRLATGNWTRGLSALCERRGRLRARHRLKSACAESRVSGP